MSSAVRISICGRTFSPWADRPIPTTFSDESTTAWSGRWRDPGGYAAWSSALRETAKWITSAGAILFSGLSFTNTMRTILSRGWLVPIVVAGLPLVAAAWAVWAAARVVTAEPPPIERLLPKLAQDRFGRSGPSVGSEQLGEIERLLPAVTTKYGGIAGLDERLVEEHGKLRAARRTIGGQANLSR